MGAVVLGAVALTACAQQPVSPTASILKDIGPVKAADVVPELITALRSDVKPDPVPGIDVAAISAAMDKQLAPLVADFQARLAQAPQHLGPAPTASNAQFADQASLALLAADVPGREYLINTSYDKGEQFTGAGIVENVTGVSETYIENGQVVIHMDMNGEASKVTGDGANAQSLVTVESLLIGERVAADGTKTGQKTYVDVCPDSSGLSHGKLYFQMAAGGNVNGPAGKSAGQARFIVTADLLGHVNDSASLTNYDLLNLSFQRSASGTGSPDPAGFFADGVSLTGVAPASAEGTAWTSGGNSVVSPSARTAIHNMKQSDVQREIGLMAIFAKLHVQELYRIAEKAWRSGRCVKVAATQGPDPKRLKPDQTTHFTIEVFHKPDNAKLDVPVVATAHNGKVAPEGKVMPPAKFTFTAAGGKPTSYGVSLKSTSRRGIGELALGFNSLQPYKLTIIARSAASVPPAVPASTSKITGTVSPDPTDTFLVGPGTAMVEVFVNTNLGCPGIFKSTGPRTFPIELKALDKGDGNFEVQGNFGTLGGLATGSEAPTTIGTFPAGDGVHTSFGSGSFTASDECTGDEPITVTTMTTVEIQADPVPS
jgi:hypothetical protein